MPWDCMYVHLPTRSAVVGTNIGRGCACKPPGAALVAGYILAMNDSATETAIASDASNSFRMQFIAAINGFAFVVAINRFYIFKTFTQLIEFTSVLAYGRVVCPLTVEASVSLGAYKGKWFRASVSYLFC